MAKKQVKTTKIPKKTKQKQDLAQPNIEAAKKLVTNRFKNAKQFRENDQEEIWKRSYNNWRGELDKSIYPWRSKLFIPWSFTVVETIIPKIFARDPKWRAISQSPDFPPEGPRVVQDLLNYQWGLIGMRTKMYDFIKDSLMYSKGFAKVTWNFKTRTKTIEEPVVGENDEITFITRKKSEIEHDDPNVEIVDPFDVYVDPDATKLEDAAYLIHRKTVPLSDLKDNPNYKNVDQLSESTIKGVQNSNYVKDYLQDETRFKNNSPQQDEAKELVEVLEYWEKDRLIVVANRSVVLRDSPNPYHHKQIPFVDLDDYRDPHKYYGQSELSVIDPLQREINSIRNQRRDYDNLALNPVVRMVPGTLRNPNSAVMAPGNVWMVSDLNSMDVFTLPQLQGTATQIEQQTAQDIKMSVAIDEIGIGLLPEGGRRSATEVVTAQSMAGKRFAIKIALLEEAVKKIGQLVFALNQQFLDQERMIQIVGERGATEWVQLGPDDIRGQYFINVETGSMLPKDEIAARQEAIQLLQYITPIIGPVIQSNPAVIMPVLRMVLDTFELPGKQEIMDELQSALGMAKEQQQQQQMAEQAAMEAQALSAMQPQGGAPAEEGMNPDVAPPENLQGARADQELALLMGNQ